MSASEKLKALDSERTFNPMHLWNALPQIVAVVEAAKTVSDIEATGELPDFAPLAEALTALDEALA